MKLKKEVKISAAVIVVVLILIIIFGIFTKFSLFNAPKSSFEVNAVFLKTSISGSEISESTIKIINTDSKIKSFSVILKNMDNFASVEEKEFSLDPGGEKNLKISFKPEKEKFDIYLGELDINSEGEIKTIPIAVEVQSKEIFFYGTLTLYPLQDELLADSKFNSEIKIYDLSNIGENSVEVFYFMKDFEGNDVISESENIIVQGKKEYSKNFDLKGIKKGDYILGIRTTYKDSVGISSIPIKIANKVLVSGLNNPSGINFQYITFFVIAFALIFMIILIIRFGIYIFEKKIKPFQNLDKDISDKRSFIYKNIEKRVELRKKLQTLENAFVSGYISRESYNKGIRRIRKMLGE